MEESGEPSSEGSGDHGSSWMKRRMREQQNEHDVSQDLHTITDERAKALLEYRARCTAARFWIQSELLDLHVSCCSPASESAGSDGNRRGHDTPAAAAEPCAPEGKNTKDLSDPGVVGDLPSLMKRHLTCPLLSKLLQQDPVLSGKLATLDHVLWDRRSKHEPQTSGWMSHDALCPDGCSLMAPCVPQGIPEVLRTSAVGVGVASNGSSRTSTMDSMVGSEGQLAAAASGVGACGKPLNAVKASAEEGRPVTAWVSCEECMEHFAYIAASLLVFLKPSELRDIAVERQQSQCCGFVFCGRRNVASPEKRRAALWHWTLDFGGSKALSEDELVQFCCSRCCSRQQQLLRLLDEEPMYTRPGIREWIGDALQRKAAYRPHPHGLRDTSQPGTPPYTQQRQQGQSNIYPGAATAVVDLPDKSSARAEPSGPPVGIDVLLSEGPGRLEAQRMVGPLLENLHSSASFSTELCSGEFSKPGTGRLAEGFRVPVTIEDESSTDQTPPKDVQEQDDRHVCTAESRNILGSRDLTSCTGKQGEEAASSFLMLNYNSNERAADASVEAPSASDPIPFEASLAAAPYAPTSTAKSGSPLPPDMASASAPLSPLRSADKIDEIEGTEARLEHYQREDTSPSDMVGTDLQSEPQRSRGSRVRFADDGEEGEDGDVAGDCVSASVFKHFFNMQDEDDGPGFYNRTDRQAATGSNAVGGQTRSGTGELRSILKPATEPVDPSPPPLSSSAEAQVGYMRLSDVVIAFDLLSSCCTDASARFLADYHSRFCTCSCEGAVPQAAATSVHQAEVDESPKLLAGTGDGGVRGMHLRKDSEADESDTVSCMDGESGDEIDPSELWRRRQQQLLKAILRSLPPSADSFAPLLTELCETFQPLQPLPTLRCSLCSCLAAILLLLLLLLRARPLTCCCCCEGCRPWCNSHERHSHCQRRQPPSAISSKKESADAATSFYFDDALTLAREENVGLALVDFVRSTIHESAPCSSPARSICGVDSSNAAEAAEASAHHHEERALHVLLESIFSRMTRPIVQVCEKGRCSLSPPQ